MTAPRPAENDRRTHEPPPPTSMKNGAPNTTVRRAVHAMPEQQPGEELAAVDRATSGRGRSCGEAGTGRPVAGAVALADLVVGVRGPRRGRARRRAAGTSPRTTWAKNQVVPSCAAYQKTVPKPKKIVVARRTAPRDRQRARAPTTRAPRRAAPSTDRDGADVGRQAPHRDERQEHDRRQRRERQERPVGRPVELAERVDVLHPVVAPGPDTGQSMATRPSRKASACHTKWL